MGEMLLRQQPIIDFKLLIKLFVFAVSNDYMNKQKQKSFTSHQM